jgi:carboxypeptidase PM20D1
MMLFLWIIPAILLVSLLLLLVIRALVCPPKRVRPVPGELPGIVPGALERLAELVKCRTVSHSDYSKFDLGEFVKFEETLIRLYPGVHKTLKREKPGDLALLYHWEGSVPALEPLLFLAHYDVVDAPGEGWDKPPFGGIIENGFLWGRGTRDMKGHLASLFEAVEALVSEGYRPARSIWFAFGGDEEVMGTMGAGVLSRLLRERGLRFSLVFDEGGIITVDQLKALLPVPVALPGLAEKGMVSLRLTAIAKPGHSSQPPVSTAIGNLSRALADLDKHPFPWKLNPTVKGLFRAISSEAPFPVRILFCNLWLFLPLVRRILSKNPSMAALLHTTQAMTIIKGGFQDNILPDQAEAVLNYRIMPDESIASVLERVSERVSRFGVTAEVNTAWPPNEPVPGTGYGTPWYSILASLVGTLMPGTITAPFLFVATTDSKAYADLTDQIIRFTPITGSSADMSMAHGFNERISEENHQMSIRFFRLFFKEAGSSR